MPQGRSLILLGHGSHLNADSASAVRQHAAAVRAQGVFGEVLEGYWKDEPALRGLLRQARFCDVTVVPLFVSEGYFTGQVIPRELGLAPVSALAPEAGPAQPVSLTEQGGRRIRYLRPYGVQPGMPEVLLARAREVRGDWDPARTALVVLGHGTGRDKRSAAAIEAAAGALRGRGQFAEVAALYLDQEPRVQDWPTLTQAPEVILVPFFASEGWHTQETIPADLGLTGPQSRIETESGPRQVFYARPVGTHPAVTAVILELAHASLAGSDPAPEHPAWQRAGRRLATVTEQTGAGELRVGELSITLQPGGAFELRHWADRTRADQDSQPRSLTAVPPEDLSAFTGRTAAGEHRPIRTLRGLRRGWQTHVAGPDLRTALHAVYPGVLEEASAWLDAELLVIPWAETAARQSGIYRRVGQATPQQLARAREEVCGRCLRTALWAQEVLQPPFLNGGPALPCPEACTLLVSAVRGQLDVPVPDLPDKPGTLPQEAPHV